MPSVVPNDLCELRSFNFPVYTLIGVTVIRLISIHIHCKINCLVFLKQKVEPCNIYDFALTLALGKIYFYMHKVVLDSCPL